MELNITKDSVVEAVVDMPKFKGLLKKTLDIEKSFTESVTIKKNESEMSDEEAKHYMYMGTDWGQVMKFINSNKSQEVKIGLNKCIAKDLAQYTADRVVVNGDATYVFEQDVFDTEELMVIHTFVPLIEHHLDRFIGNMIFDYSEKTFQL